MRTRPNNWLLAKIDPGSGLALDIGGGAGRLGSEIRNRGYAYINADPLATGDGAVRAVGEHLPFKDSSFTLLVSEDSLEHVSDPAGTLREARRVLDPNGLLVIWVPFMHPFHGDDLWRFSPLGLEKVLGDSGFTIASLEAPLGAASVVAQIVAEVFRRIGLRSAEHPLESLGAWIDRTLSKTMGAGKAFAEAFLVVAFPVAADSDLT